MLWKSFKSKTPKYLFKLIPEKKFPYVTKNAGNIPLFNIKHNFYKNSFFPPTITERNDLDSNLDFGIFKNNILKFIRPKPNSFFSCCNLKEIKLITRLRLELSHLHEHKYKYNFQNCLNPLYSCGSSTDRPFSSPLSYISRNHRLSFIHWKIWRTSFLEKKTLFFICNSLILSELPLIYYIYLFFILNCYFYLFFLVFFCTPRELRFSALGDCDLGYCVTLYINIYIYIYIYIYT